MDKLIFHYGAGGALVCDTEIPGVTQKIDGDTSEFYGGSHFVAESMTKKTAEKIAQLLGGELASDTEAKAQP